MPPPASTAARRQPGVGNNQRGRPFYLQQDDDRRCQGMGGPAVLAADIQDRDEQGPAVNSKPGVSLKRTGNMEKGLSMFPSSKYNRDKSK